MLEKRKVYGEKGHYVYVVENFIIDGIIIYVTKVPSDDINENETIELSVAGQSDTSEVFEIIYTYTRKGFKEAAQSILKHLAKK
ncbi:MAG: hypothetical protein WC976_06270 [Caldisericia bacterium]